MRLQSIELYQKAFENLGLKSTANILKPHWFARRNFHGVFYLDSFKLNHMYHYVKDDESYIAHCVKAYTHGWNAVIKFLLKFPPIRFVAEGIAKLQMLTQAKKDDGILGFLKHKQKAKLQAFGVETVAKSEPLEIKADPHASPSTYENPCDPPKTDALKPLDDKVLAQKIWLNHGYDEHKPKYLLNLNDMQKAAEFRGGKLLSQSMNQGDLKTPLEFECQFGHTFHASPKLILEGGHWCPVCEKTSWNHANIAKGNPFFAQVWFPLHPKNEAPLEVKKEVSEDEVG